MNETTPQRLTPVRMRDLAPGDTVLIRATVIEAHEGVGAFVELLSKTDQYKAWIREDLVEQGGYVEPPWAAGTLVREIGTFGPTWLYLPHGPGGGDQAPFIALEGDRQGTRMTREELPARLADLGPVTG